MGDEKKKHGMVMVIAIGAKPKKGSKEIGVKKGSCCSCYKSCGCGQDGCICKNRGC